MRTDYELRQYLVKKTQKNIPMKKLLAFYRRAAYGEKYGSAMYAYHSWLLGLEIKEGLK
jgi:hypothetical protein